MAGVLPSSTGSVGQDGPSPTCIPIPSFARYRQLLDMYAKVAALTPLTFSLSEDTAGTVFVLLTVWVSRCHRTGHADQRAAPAPLFWDCATMSPPVAVQSPECQGEMNE